MLNSILHVIGSSLSVGKLVEIIFVFTICIIYKLSAMQSKTYLNDERAVAEV